VDSTYSLTNGLRLEWLTWREQDILSLLAERYTNREIAQNLGLALTTVKWYNQQIYGKLGVKNRREAVAQVETLGLLEEQPDMTTSALAPSEYSLPAQVTSFIGRKRDLDEVERLLQSARLVTLTGPGGIGKTRLGAKAVSRLIGHFKDGIRYVELASLTNPDLVASTIAGVLGLQQHPTRPITETLQDYLRPRQLLLVLDNFEHLLEAAPLVADLLTAAPGLTVLAVSREVLGLYGEQAYAVPPLTLPPQDSSESLLALSDYESVRLFVERSAAARADFELTDENAPLVAELCACLDGLPLAIELAAARTRLLTLEALRDQLSDRFEALKGGPRDAHARQQTLRATFDWSYDLMDMDEKTLLARLSVFQGGRTVQAVEAVCVHGLRLDALDGLELLLNKGWLQREEAPKGTLRFVMLETIHDYAREKLQEHEEIEAMRTRHAGYFMALMEQAEPHLSGGRHQLRWMGRLEAEHDNLRTALKWALEGGDVELGLRLAGALGWFWFRQGHYADWQRWITHALELSEGAPLALRALVLLWAGQLAWAQQEPQRAKPLFREALALYRELGDKPNIAFSLTSLGRQSIGVLDEFDEARALSEEALEMFRKLDDKPGITKALTDLGLLYNCVPSGLERAKAAFQECLVLAHEMDDRLREQITYLNLGVTAYQESDYEQAGVFLRESLTLGSELGTKLMITGDLTELAAPLANAQGQPERAARLLGASNALHEAMGTCLQPACQEVFNRTLASVREQLDETTLNTALDEGHAMSMDEALAYALGQDVV
jgi:predicted ATPase/DNA-binding CsgD family transcriptional regulator